MKRWIWLPMAALLAFSACDDKDVKSGPARSGAGSASAAPQTRRAAPGARGAEDLTRRTPGQTDASGAPTDEAAAGSGDRFFDGAALRDAGFAVPSGDGAVYAGGGSSRAWPLAYANPASRPKRTDLNGAEPPLPESARYPASSESASRGAGEVVAAFDGFQRRMYDAAAPILSRAGWRAAKRKGRAIPMTPTHVTVHHTEGAQTMTEAATAAEVRSIQHYHMAGRAREGKDVWDDIGYHFLIDGAGRVVEGRPAETLGAHAGGANQDNIGIAMMGNFMKVKPTAAQVESLTRLVSFLAIKYGQDPARPGFLEGHKHYDNTDCPGTNMMAILAALRQRVDVQTLRLQARLKAAPKGQFVPVLASA